MKTIEMQLSTSSVQKAIEELKAYEKSFERKLDIFMERLAEYGVQAAKDGLFEYGTIPTKGKSIRESLRPVKDGNGWMVITDSDHAAFVEFGTGLKGQGTYPGEPPSGYEYNAGRNLAYHDPDGSWHFWVDGEEYVTQGQQAQFFMGRAANKMKQKVIEVATEVFNES